MILEIYFAAMSILPGLIQVESRGNASSYNAKEDAAGCLQIRPIMVREAQRLGINFTLDDRWNCEKSMGLFIALQMVKGRTDPEAMARCWNGGPKGMKKESTLHYWDFTYCCGNHRKTLFSSQDSLTNREEQPSLTFFL